MKTQHKMECGLFLNVVVTQCTPILKLLTSKDETLLVRGNTLLVLNLRLHVVNRVRGLNIKGDGLASQCLHKDLHSSTKTQHKMECGLLLNVVVTQCATILKLLTSKDETLLVRGNTLLVLNLRLHVVNRVGGLNIQSDGLASQCLHKDLHS